MTMQRQMQEKTVAAIPATGFAPVSAWSLLSVRQKLRALKKKSLYISSWPFLWFSFTCGD